MIMRLLLPAISCAVLLVGAAPPEIEVRNFYDGNALLDLCREGSPAMGQCWGYDAGVADAVSAIEPENRQACIPVSVPISQAVDITTRWLREHPARRHFAATLLVAEALNAAFPCTPATQRRLPQ
jgi:hypothetical protein